ncbi:MAG: ABC transporter ATP-binding protein [Candidatus Sulfopaludibacter sp.]|nr:ABC transporter ATP-binding protein [Candidatus Sulfopaludibacter sp.]
MEAEPLLSVRNLGRNYTARRRWGKSAPERWAIRGVSFELGREQTLGLVGPSGAGKSTLARCLALFEMPDSGEILLQGRPLRRCDVQLIPQQPAASFNPRFTAGEAVAEPLAIQKRGNRAMRWEAARRAMDRVGLPMHAAARPVMEFSGGEHQRLAIARALTLEPALLILDESLSALDTSAQCQVLDLLRALQAELDLTYILISHDLALVERMAGEIAVMDEGRMVEHRPSWELVAAPRHATTQRLVQAALALSAEEAPR